MYSTKLIMLASAFGLMTVMVNAATNYDVQKTSGNVVKVTETWVAGDTKYTTEREIKKSDEVERLNTEIKNIQLFIRQIADQINERQVKYSQLQEMLADEMNKQATIEAVAVDEEPKTAPEPTPDPVVEGDPVAQP